MPSENIHYRERVKKCEKCGVVVSRKPSKNVELRYICDCTNDPKSTMRIETFIHKFPLGDWSSEIYK